MLLELADRLVRERAPVLVLFHVGDQRRLGANETRRLGAERLPDPSACHERTWRSR